MYACLCQGIRSYEEVPTVNYYIMCDAAQYMSTGGLSSLSFHGHDVLFAHWPTTAAQLKPVVPDEFEVATFDGNAWIGVLAHEVTTKAASLPVDQRFAQLNVRTYVRHGDTTGVYFITLLTGSRLGGLVGDQLLELPIQHASVSTTRRDNRISFRSSGRAKGRPVRFDARYNTAAGGTIPDEQSLEAFLVERDRYFTQTDGEVRMGEIERDPWRLAPTKASIRSCLLPIDGHLEPESAVCHYSPGYEMTLRRISSADTA